MRHHDRVPAFVSTNLLIIVTLLIALSVAPASTNAAPLDVCKSGCTFSTIQAAINAAAPNDTISIAADTYFENLTINKNLTLSGAGNATTTIDGNHAAAVVTISNAAIVNIDGVTIQNGTSSNGGGVNNLGGTVGLTNSAINHNTATGLGTLESGGGGIYSSGGHITLTNSAVSDNQISGAGHGAGINVITATLDMIGTTVASNITTGDAGGIFAYTSTLTLQASTIISNTGKYGGGIEVYHSGSSVTLRDNSIVRNNTAANAGGGIANASGVLTVTDSIIRDNVANGNGDGGGGIWSAGDTTLIHSTISGNVAAQGTGGGIDNTQGPDKLLLDASTVSNNTSAGFGGGIYSVGGTVALTNNSLVSGNQTTALGAHGGGLSLDTVTLEMTGSTVSGNSSALGDGGGIWGGDNSTLTLNNSTISNNTAPNGAGGGIDIYINTNLTLNGSTISGNTAGVFGGGIYNDVSTITLLNNSNVTSNTATGLGGGGGIYNDGATTLTDSTISGNVASQGDGGGIHNIASAILTVDHGTISGNRAGSVGGGIASHSISLAVLKNNSTVSGNTAAGSGGGIYNGATLQIDNTTIADNIVDSTTTNANGGGIANVAQATINASRILRNRAVAAAGGLVSNGAGIINQGGELTLTNSTINDNVLEARNGARIGAGGGIFSLQDQPLTIHGGEINGNQGTGVYIDAGGTATLTDVTVNNNHAPSEGGGIFIGANTTAQIVGGSIQHNTSSTHGGGVSIDSNAIATLTDVIISDNRSTAEAGGVYIGASTLPTATVTMTRVRIEQNDAVNSAGGIGTQGRVTIVNSQINANTAHTAQPTIGSEVVTAVGGGIDNNGFLTILDSKINGNRLENPLGDGIWGNGVATIPEAREWGGGIASEVSSTLILSNTIISGHQVGGNPGLSDGGGLYLVGKTAVLTNVLISGNEALGNGGGIFAQGTALTIAGSTISNNRATFANLPNLASCPPNPTGCQYNEGGGIHINSSGTLTITNSTLSGNHSDNIVGAIFLQGSSIRADLDHVTITANSANQGGGVWVNNQPLPIRVRDSIIAGNLSQIDSARADCAGGLISEGGNIFGATNDPFDCNVIASDILTDTAHLQLGLLKPRGGPTPTHALLPGSPALAATQRCPAQDQRGIARPQSGGCAIGAYEPGRATQLDFIDEPTDSPFNGDPFGGPFRVIARDDLGNAGSLTTDVSLGIATDPNHDQAGSSHLNLNIPPAKLIGGTSKRLVDGEAVFTSIGIDQPGNGFVLSATAGTLHSTSAPLNVRTRTPLPVPKGSDPADPYESNDSIDVAVPIIFDANNVADYRATISSENDVDVFRFIARPSSHITITLERPDEYDLVLLRDPKDVAADITDTLDLSNLITLQRSDTPRGMVPRGMVPRGMVPSNLVSDTQSLDSLVVDANANPGTDPISLELRLPLGGTYYIAALSTRHKFNVSNQYHLHVELQPGNLQLPDVVAQRPGDLNIERSLDVRNIFLTNFPRMSARYDPAEQQAATGEIQALLRPGSAVMTQGVVLDLPTVLGKEDREHLDALYNQWDAAPNQPLLANEVANQIQRVLIEALRTYYPNATNLVLVGGDDVLPFARVPDENKYGNEQGYFASLQLEAPALLQKSAFAASLSNGFMQTDDFYARRRSVIYRGRQLALPDLGVGRLVELPTDIARYLRAYASPASLVVRADQATGDQSNTLVTSYGFLDDEAKALVNTLTDLGVSNVAQLTDRSKTDLPVPDMPWNTSMLEDRWFSGQLPQLTSHYTPTVGTPSTRYALVSLNGHFSHHDTEPADNTLHSNLEAARVLTPTVAEGSEPYAFFKRWQAGLESATLLYSIGCHSGLSAPDSVFGADQAGLESADFASAVVKQGGNWIGNTGYGYADTDVVGYSEQLAAFFTHELGRNVAVGAEAPYLPTTIGQAMMRAKQRYVREKGVGGFSVADEKVITGWTLYGLPFIQVSVPTPFQDPAPPETIPPALSSNGTFTRTITVTANWRPYETSAIKLWEEGAVLATITDSLAPGHTQNITGTAQGGPGAAVLPVLSIPLRIPLQNDRSAPELPQLRGVRLLEASGIPAEPFSPKVTSPVTDRSTESASPGRDLSILDLWTPNLTYGAVRIAIDDQGTASQLRDVLLVHPAQFRANSLRSGDLRRFKTMVLQLTYVDPRSASPILLADHQAPLITDTHSGVIDNSFDALGTQAVTFTVQVSNDLALQRQIAMQRAVGTPNPGTSVRVIYTADGINWGSATLLPDPVDGSSYKATVRVALKGQGMFAYLEAGDTAGNVTTRVVDQGVFRLTLPVIRR